MDKYEQALKNLHIPQYMWHGIINYLEKRILPGDFLQAVICNDFKKAVMFADAENQVHLKEYVMFFYNYAPAICWGSKEKMLNWINEE